MKSTSPAPLPQEKSRAPRFAGLLTALMLFSLAPIGAEAKVSASVSNAPLARFEGRFVLVTAVSPSSPASLEALGRELDTTVAEMAPRIPLVVERPLRIVIEPDYLGQTRATGEVGEAVVNGDSIHLVLHPDDGYAYRFALAQVLLRRAGLAPSQPWITRGAALWLSRQWFGRNFGDWLPLLRAARALPTAADLVVTELQKNGSAPLWTPVAAALIERRAGATLTAKLTQPFVVAELERGLAALVREAGAQLASSKAPPPRQGFLRGISFAMLISRDHGYQSPHVNEALARLVKLGANSVAIMPFAGQREPRAPGMGFMNRSPTSETDIACLHAARRAHAAGLSVLWKPHVWVGGDSWPGEVEMTNEEDWRTWWAVYRRYILHHAFLARWAGAELFSVGVELDKTASRPEWPELISDVRRLFPGRLTYASNWYGGLEKIPFWAELDYVGVDAYFPLSPSPTASDRELAAGARQVAERLGQLSRAVGKPLLLTEVGFAAHQAAWAEPHKEGGAFSEIDQARAYHALLAALEGQKWLAGLWFWKAFSGAEELMGPEPDFRFLGRAAEGEIARFFRVVGAPSVK